MKCAFCEFSKGIKKVHNNGYPFLFLRQSKLIFSFLASDPPKKGFHIILTTKNHYGSFEDIPEKITVLLMKEMQFIVKKIRSKKYGCNILMNEGKSAGQTERHVHVHIISREKNDGTKIEIWKRRKIGKKSFLMIQDKVRKLMV